MVFPVISLDTEYNIRKVGLTGSGGVMKKIGLVIMLIAMSVCTVFAGGGKDSSADDKMSGTLVLSLWDNDSYKLFISCPKHIDKYIVSTYNN